MTFSASSSPLSSVTFLRQPDSTIFSLWNAGLSPKHFRNHKSTFKCNKNQCNFVLSPPKNQCQELFWTTDSDKWCGDTVPNKVSIWRACCVTFLTWFSYFLSSWFSKEVVIAFIQKTRERLWNILLEISIWATGFSFPMWYTIKLFYQIKLQSSFAAAIS